MPRRRFPSIVVASVIVIGAAMPAYAQPGVTESQIKAAVISKLVAFVEWPPAVLAAPRTLDVCVAGNGSLASDLRELELNATVQGHVVAVRSVQRDQDVVGCHVLVMPAAPGGRGMSYGLLHKVASLPILTVSDGQNFLDDGGMVQLRIVAGRPRFDINDAAAQQVGLKISSRLLGLADTVRRGKG
jgi:hypothetical protein